MAKGPGPALALAGVAALFLLKGKKKAAAAPTSIIDPEGDATEEDVGGGPVGGGGGGGGGSSSENPKTVPNPSGDPKGYNTTLYPGAFPVRMALSGLGYDISLSAATAPLSTAQDRAAVRKFQKDYSQGNVTVELGPYAGDAVPGYLEEDEGIAGKNVLNALEIVVGGFPLGKWSSYYN